MNTNRKKHGFHYLPDTRTFRESDLNLWLARLQALNAGWLVLRAPTDRAIPERFLTTLLEQDIEPVLHFQEIRTGSPSQNVSELQPLFEIYARWGVRHVALFDRPNMRRTWQTQQWVQSDLVEHFLDQYLPLANASLQCGLTPIFPPLEPGGDYWDTAFLRAALQNIQRRGHQALLDKLILGAIAATRGHHLNWGAGGPERWPEARPYASLQTTEDQCGFRIFDWYIPIARAVLSRSLPVFLFEMGARLSDTDSPQAHAQINLQIASLLAGETVSSSETLPEAVIGGAFWPWADPDDPQTAGEWFKADGKNLPAVKAIEQWLGQGRLAQKSPSAVQHPITHYLLLPIYEWGIADYHLEVIRPFVKKYQPTVGFSPTEAARARRVTVVGDRKTFPDELLNQLRANGCIVDRIDGSGTELATLIAAL